MKPSTDSVDPLLAFRLAYLKVIALSWRDKEFYRRLLPPAPDNKPILTPDIQPILVEQGMPWTWSRLSIRLFLDNKPSEQTKWDPVLTGGWIGQDDRFVITLPQAPASADAAQALAAYYQLFPTFMGPVAPAAPQPSPAAEALDTGLGIPGGGPGSLLAFGGVILRAIALGWKSKQFLNELLEAHPDATSVLSQWLGYNNPFNFQLRFVANERFTWNPDGDGQWNLDAIKNDIILNYPVAPDDEAMRPIALTSYNNTGSAYPFTC